MLAPMEERAASPLRMVAPVALTVCALIVVAILLSSGGAGSSSGDSATSGVQKGGGAKVGGAKGKRDKLADGVYTVKSGDTLDLIAEKTGLSVEQLQELNPTADSQALVSGQKLKLRE